MLCATSWLLPLSSSPSRGSTPRGARTRARGEEDSPLVSGGVGCEHTQAARGGCERCVRRPRQTDRGGSRRDENASASANNPGVWLGHRGVIRKNEMTSKGRASFFLAQQPTTTCRASGEHPPAMIDSPRRPPPHITAGVGCAAAPTTALTCLRRPRSFRVCVLGRRVVLFEVARVRDSWAAWVWPNAACRPPGNWPSQSAVGEDEGG